MHWYKLSENERLQSLKKVRRIHLAVSKSNIMTQYDMVLTQWAFIAPAFLKPNQIGMDTLTKEDLEGIKYVFYVVGHALGIDDLYNLCDLSLDLEDTVEYMELIFQNDIKYFLKSQSESSISHLMSQHLLLAIEMINPYLKPESFKYWAFHLLECPLDIKSIKHSILSYNLLHIFFNQLLCGRIGHLFRPLLNTLMRLNIYLANLWRNHILHEKRRPFL